MTTAVSDARLGKLPPITIELKFDRGFISRPRTFYERLECREWLTWLDWQYAETSDRLATLTLAEEIERELDILRLLEIQIREAERLQLELSLPEVGQ